MAKGSKLNKAAQMRKWSQIKVRWYFASIFPGAQANNPSLRSRTKCTDARLARPYICASWSRQSIGKTRQQVRKIQVDVSPKALTNGHSLIWRDFTKRLNQIVRMMWTLKFQDKYFWKMNIKLKHFETRKGSVDSSRNSQIEMVFGRKCHVWFHLWKSSRVLFRVVAIHNPLIPFSWCSIPNVHFRHIVVGLVSECCIVQLSFSILSSKSSHIYFCVSVQIYSDFPFNARE
jgi:hypothetical protein